MNKPISQLNLINIYRTPHPTPAECTFFSSYIHQGTP